MGGRIFPKQNFSPAKKKIIMKIYIDYLVAKIISIDYFEHRSHKLRRLGIKFFLKKNIEIMHTLTHLFFGKTLSGFQFSEE